MKLLETYLKPCKKGVLYIFTVSEVAEICGVTSQSINKRIKNMSAEQLEKYVVFLKPNETKLKQVSKQGLLYFKSVYGVIDEPIAAEDTAEKENAVVSALIEQLKQKDIQLAEQAKQIEMLMEQAKNYQVLLQGQQVLSLPEKKRPFFKRLFSRGDDEK